MDTTPTVIATAIAIAVLGACGGSSATDGRTDASGYEWSNSPAPLVLHLPTGDVELHTQGCWDGPPDDEGVSVSQCTDGGRVMADDLRDAGRHDSLELSFGMSDWDWDAELIDPVDSELEDEVCARVAVIEQINDRTFRIHPVGPAGTYRVNLFGEGPQGDQHTDLLWTTTVKGPAGGRHSC
ncbi:MAG TPA: hypothetical protein VD859_16040 [Nocardioides sp.]|nr:hypothetical protein [Nocardioides sp.]